MNSDIDSFDAFIPLISVRLKLSTLLLVTDVMDHLIFVRLRTLHAFVCV